MRPYVYSRARRQFGVHRTFSQTQPQVVCDIKPDPSLASNWVDRAICHRGVQIAPAMSEHEVNTQRVTLTSTGVLHTEGGWPKEIDATDKEHTSRFKKKIERDPKYLSALRQIVAPVEAVVRQNNALDITERYFPPGSSLSQEGASDPSALSLKVLTVLRDPQVLRRWARSVAWGPDVGGRSRKLAVCYSTMRFQHELELQRQFAGRGAAIVSTSSFVWDVESPGAPDVELTSPSSITCLQYSPKDSHILVGGCYNGLVSCWDARVGGAPSMSSVIEASHSDPVSAVTFTKSKSGTELMTVSTDGQVLWWDVRKLAEPVERLTMTLPPWAADGTTGKKTSAPVHLTPEQEERCKCPLGLSSLAYDANAGLHKFVIGAENGLAFSCNRKAKTPADVVTNVFGAHHGPVASVMRSPFFPKVFLTAGDWSVKVWTEDARNPILASAYASSHLTCGAWSPSRPGVFCTTRRDGYLDIWDLYHKTSSPSSSLKVCDSPLRCAVWDPAGATTAGRLLACGAEDGSVTIVEAGAGLYVAQPQEKAGVAQLLERETQRERSLEARLRERKARRAASHRPAKGAGEDALTAPDALLHAVEESFFAAVRSVEDAE
jgi:dynein intermediate chain 2